jgi:hypothetical protein
LSKVREVCPLTNSHVGFNRSATSRAQAGRARDVETLECHQIVPKTGAKRAKTEQIQKTEILAILRLAKGFS